MTQPTDLVSATTEDERDVPIISMFNVEAQNTWRRPPLFSVFVFVVLTNYVTKSKSDIHCAHCTEPITMKRNTRSRSSSSLSPLLLVSRKRPPTRLLSNTCTCSNLMLPCLVLLLLSLTGSSCFVHQRFSLVRPSRRQQQGSSRSFLQQSTTTSTLPTTVTLQWADFYTPETSSSTSKPPVVLLHGLLGSKRNFASLATSLSAQLETPRRILGVDLRNHGESEWSDTMSYHDMALDVLQFLDAQQLQQVVIVGHSMGGKVAQALSLMHPERVAGLVVIDIAPVAYTSADPHWKAVEDIMQAMQEATDVSTTSTSTSTSTSASTSSITITKQAMDQQLKTAVPDPALRAFCLTNYNGREGRWNIPLDAIVDQLDTLAGFDLDLEGLSYDGDVFIINGGQSRFVRHAYMDRIAAFFPNHMLTTIRGAGHWVHAEAPDDTVALLKRYLDR
jgi:esterase